MRNDYFNDPNSLTIIANDFTITPKADQRRGYRDIRASVEIKVSHYDLKAVLISLLEDYSEKDLVELIHEIETN